MQLLFLQHCAELFHLAQRGGNQPADPNQVGMMAAGCLDDLPVVDHHAQVNDLKIVAGEDNVDNVFPDVVHVAFGSSEDNFGAASVPSFLLVLFLNFRLEHRDGGFHGFGGFDHLRQEHFPLAEKRAHFVHALHERSFDNCHCGRVGGKRFCQVVLQVFGIALDQSVFQAFVQRAGAPFFLLGVFPLCRFESFDFFRKRDEAFGGFGSLV